MAQKKLEGLFASVVSPIPFPPPLPTPIAVDTATGEKSASIESMLRVASNKSSFSKSSSGPSILSTHASPFEKPNFLGKDLPVFQWAPQAQVNDTKADIASGTDDKDREETVDPTPNPLAIVVDTTGDRRDESTTTEQPLISDHESALSNGKTPQQSAELDDEEESDTEEVYPRHIPLASNEGSSSLSMYPKVLPTVVSSSDAGAGASVAAQPAHLATKPYARVIDDDVPISRLPKPSVSVLSAQAQEFVSSATSTSARTFASLSKKAAKKERLRAVKERKKERKRGASSGKGKRTPRDDSDIEWGSDGPPQMTHNDDEEANIASSETAISTSVRKFKNGRGRGGRQSAIDLAMEDYLMNVSSRHRGSSDSGSSEAETSTGSNELARLRRFAASMSSKAEHLTIDDLDDIAKIRQEDLLYDEALEEFVLRQGLRRANDFPVYRPTPPDWVSDPDDDNNRIFKSDDEDVEGNPKVRKRRLPIMLSVGRADLNFDFADLRCMGGSWKEVHAGHEQRSLD